MTSNTSSSPTSGRASSRSSGVTVALAAAIVAVIAAAGCAVWFGYQGYQAYFVQKPIQEARDGAVNGAEQAIINVTTVDPRDTADWKRRVDASLTGKAREQITNQDVNNLNSMISDAGPQAATLTSRLMRSAPTEVDADGGNAKVLVYVAATSKRENEAGVTQTMGFSVSMTKDGDSWKANDIVPLDSLQYQDPGTAAATEDNGEGADSSGNTDSSGGGGN
ncbi:conjugal transfer protein [Gordonia mangrovi]|uniref:conjugal transfer protein n=1 Tax=Gordonia mangrovi TaxID=2665643 RepID=UPI001F3A71CA|nr:conjugal transfer protein [Gordonia mangrovi]UVF79050.1 conjugal transfer protein [Gordonia mangrovi]